MAINKFPIYASAPDLLQATLTAANTTLTDTPNNTVELVLSSNYEVYGGNIVGLQAMPRAVSAATALHIYGSFDNGTTKMLLLTAAAAAQASISTTQPPAAVPFSYRGSVISRSNPFPIPPGQGANKFRLYAGIGVALAEGWIVAADCERHDGITL